MAKENKNLRWIRILTAVTGSVVVLIWFRYSVNLWIFELLDPPSGSEVGPYIYIISVIDFVLIGAYLGAVLKKNPPRDMAILFSALVVGFTVFCLLGGWRWYF